MAAYNFEDATLKLYFETGVDASGNPVVTSKTYRNVRDNLLVENVAAVVQAIATLSSYPLSQAKKTETDDIQF